MTETKKTCQCNRFQSLGMCDHVRPFEPVTWTPPPYPEMELHVALFAPESTTQGGPDKMIVTWLPHVYR